MSYYIAWLDGYSVARDVFATPDYQQWGCKGGVTTLKITRGPRQTFMRSFSLSKLEYDREAGQS